MTGPPVAPSTTDTVHILSDDEAHRWLTRILRVTGNDVLGAIAFA